MKFDHKKPLLIASILLLIICAIMVWAIFQSDYQSPSESLTRYQERLRLEMNK
jgi:hypothetical protein